ncbi:MAG: FMN-binding glutamate synthase family protein [Sulfuricurvum sp.]|nr:FMN-binding glutamate synthase family protein [Sulfuricurvum sp.]
MFESIENNILYAVKEVIEFGFWIIPVFLIILFVHDRYVQRTHQLLVHYPIIGRMRYLFEALREPMRQYFANESFYDSRDKIDWVYKAAKNVPNFMSFSLTQPFTGSRFIVKHSSHVLNEAELSPDLGLTFGEKRPKPYKTATPILRSAMSDGALSPEGIRSFAMGSTIGHFPVNTGEGGLTSNFFYTHRPDLKEMEYLEVVNGNWFAELVFKISAFLFNRGIAIKMYRRVLLNSNTENTYLYDPISHILFRINWDAPLSAFPKEVPSDMPDIVFQIGSGLYGVRDKNGVFDFDRYAKVMRFCRMTEIKIAQGAKQTGGKLTAAKVSDDIAYYRGVEAHKDLISPNRFPFASSDEELLDFIAKLQDISLKPVGMKIVISDDANVRSLAETMSQRKRGGKNNPDFITVDSGDGGSATAPLELMGSVGLTTLNALYILDTVMKDYGLRDDLKIIASGKILTPDDVIITLAMGADAVGIARGFMMSAGCIRARMCAGTGSHHCPVGLATQDPALRASFLVLRKAGEIANYHNNLLKGIKNMLAVMGIHKVTELSRNHLTFKNENGEIYFDVNMYFHQKFHH